MDSDEIGAVLVLVGVGTAAGVLLTYVLLRLVRSTPAAMLPALIAVLTGGSIIGFCITRAESLATLAGTGLGALATALTSIYHREADRSPPPPDQAQGDDPEKPPGKA